MSHCNEECDVAESTPTKADPEALCLRPIHFTSPLQVEGAVYALRMIDGAHWHARLVRNNRICDSDIFSLLGLDCDDSAGDRITLTRMRRLVTERRAILEGQMRSRPDALARNIAKLGLALKLNPTETAILRLAIVATRVEHFDDLLRHCVSGLYDFVRGVCAATGHSMDQVQRAIASNRPLRRSGFLCNGGFQSSPLEVESTVADALVAPTFDVEVFLRRLVRRAPPAELALADYEHVADLALVRRYLSRCVRRRCRGVNVLIYGSAGTGKTQFVRALAQELGVELFEVPNEDKDGDPISGQRRMSSYAICQQLLANLRSKLLMFDEVEDVFGATDVLSGFGARGYRDRDAESLRKSWINELLESNPVPAVWVCNSIGTIDRAFLRRFDLVVECGLPNRRVRERMLNRYFSDSSLSSGCIERLSSLEQLPPAQIERAARVVRALSSRTVAERDREAERVLECSLKAMRVPTDARAPELPAHYDPTFLNTDRALDAVTAGLARTRSARLCLYGPPGTGKTAYAHYLGRQLDMPVVVKRGSDLISMWVGQTEELIATAFRSARDAGAILVIDEADGFLRDRSGAQRSWEVTQVNELLTQMEAFEGIFIASTNLVTTLDAASLRRFDFKIRFDSLTREQRRRLLCAFCATDASDTSIGPALTAIDRLDGLTPGDFAAVRRQLRVTGQDLTPDAVVARLAAEVAMKPGQRVRPIGFVH